MVTLRWLLLLDVLNHWLVLVGILIGLFEVIALHSNHFTYRSVILCCSHNGYFVVILSKSFCKGD
jgi:hypothetical protein